MLLYCYVIVVQFTLTLYLLTLFSLEPCPESVEKNRFFQRTEDVGNETISVKLDS